jgi:hypothetical protein
MLIHNAEVTGSLLVNGIPYNTGSFSGSFLGTISTASYVEYNNVANKPALLSGSAQVTAFGFATTGSNQFNGNQTVTGSLTVTGQVIAQTLNVQQVTSSIIYSSGSNVFGNSLANTQQFTGSMSVTGSMTVNGALTGTSATLSSSVTANSFISINGNSAGTNTYLEYKNNGTALGYVGSSAAIITGGAAGNLAIGTNANLSFATGTAYTERMRITSDGNVLIGTTTDAGPKLQVNGAIRVLDGNTLTLMNPGNTNGSNIRSVTEGDFRVTTGGTTDALTISNLGNIGLNGKTNVVKSHSDYVLTVQNADSAGYGIFIRAGGTNPLIDGYNFNSSAIFRVSGTGVIFAQNTSVQSISDIRTKENIRKSEDGLNIINKLNTVRFDFKNGFNGDKKNQLGFIAQEVEEIFPEIVNEWTDYENDSIIYKTIGPSGLIPVLVKAIQEQQIEIENLKSKI